MPARQPPPTEGELEVLRICCRIGRARTRVIHEALVAERKGKGMSPLSFNTVATVLSKLEEKRLVKRFDDDATRHEFEATKSEAEINKSVANDVIHRLFGGSVIGLVQSAFRGRKPSAKEMSALRKLIDDAAKSEEA